MKPAAPKLLGKFVTCSHHIPSSVWTVSHNLEETCSSWLLPETGKQRLDHTFNILNVFWGGCKGPEAGMQHELWSHLGQVCSAGHHFEGKEFGENISAVYHLPCTSYTLCSVSLFMLFPLSEMLFPLSCLTTY